MTTGLLIAIVLEMLAEVHGPSGSFVVRVNVTVRAAISAALGVYVTIKVVRLGLNVPVPPNHEAEEAPPPKDPVKLIGTSEHIVRSDEMVTVGAGFIVTTISSYTDVQTPAGSSVVYLIVTEPALMSARLGVYIAVGLLLLKEPVPELVHVAEVAPPPNEPFIVTVDPEHIV